MMTMEKARKLVEEAAKACGLMQSWEEAAQFVQLISSRSIRNILELGTNSGGMMYIMDKACEAGLRISMDRPWDQRDPDVSSRQAGFYRYMPHVIEILGDIHAEEQIGKLNSILEGRMLDLIFVDADHSEEGSRKHFKMYAPFVDLGGLVAMHDVRNGWDCGKTFEALCKYYNHQVIEDIPERHYGIGVLFL